MQHGSSVPLALSIRLSGFEARSDVSEDASLSDAERVSENQVRARTYGTAFQRVARQRSVQAGETMASSDR